ncbi:MAG: glycosyltransferase family 2 protein [Flavobacteriales bacterium]|nr:glycosyltransferase family 2 protein [Flavobacteriales bacterium]
MTPSVAVVILNWNGRRHLETYMPSVIAHSGNAVVYLADNASTDDSINYVKQQFPSVRFIINKENGGFAKGYNDALADLKEDYFVLLNSDVEVTSNWIQPVIDELEARENVFIAQPKIKSYLEKNKFEYAGAGGGFIDVLGYPFCQGRMFDHLEEDNGQYDTIREIFWATGACMFIKASLFKELNGFDERYFAHMEEIDLCWRAKNIGKSVFYVPTSTVYHLGGGTMQNTNPRKTFLNFRNSLLTLYKNDITPYRRLKVLFRLLLDAVAFVKLLFSSGPKHAFAIVKAHFSFYGMKKIRSKVLQPNPTGILKSSIVFDYYLKGVRRFSQLK